MVDVKAVHDQARSTLGEAYCPASEKAQQANVLCRGMADGYDVLAMEKERRRC